MDNFEKLLAIVNGLTKKFPDGNEPFQIITRLCEESGELAKEVNHFEKTGIKIQKYGQPDPQDLANEVQHVIRSALAIAQYYNVGDYLDKSIDATFQKLTVDGFIN